MKKLSIILCFLLIGCAGISIGPVAQDLIAYNLGIEFGIQHPELVETATVYCDTILQSDDQEFISKSILVGLGYLSENIDNPRIAGNVKRILKNLKIETGEIDIGAVRMAVESFRDGLQ